MHAVIIKKKNNNKININALGTGNYICKCRPLRSDTNAVGRQNFLLQYATYYLENPFFNGRFFGKTTFTIAKTVSDGLTQVTPYTKRHVAIKCVITSYFGDRLQRSVKRNERYYFAVCNFPYLLNVGRNYIFSYNKNACSLCPAAHEYKNEFYEIITIVYGINIKNRQSCRTSLVLKTTK